MKPPVTTLGQLLKGLPTRQVKGDLTTTVNSLTTDSRRVVPGTLFFAIRGSRTDGNYFLEEAIDRGASGVVTDQPPGSHGRFVYVQVDHVRSALAQVARRFYGDPGRDMRVAGVTGTNGKTTVTMLLQHLLRTEERPVGLIGTIRYDLGQRTFPSYKTTPESVDVFAMLAQMREAGCREAVMEVSSHGIDQHRVEGVRYHAAAFLNLTQDHLDYHHTLDNYFETKARLFDGSAGLEPPAHAILNRDDARCSDLYRRIPPASRVLTFGLHPQADLGAEEVRLGADGSRFLLRWGGQTREVASPLLGSFNVSNVLAAVGLGLAFGRDLDSLLARLEAFTGVPGRLERVEAGQPYPVLVDYAHTDDALRNVLRVLRPLTAGRIITVFGCGGNRDRAKRPLMTRAVLEGADFAVATADNPRKEPLEQIFQDMKGALRPGDAGAIRFIEDRRAAIHEALRLARAGDCVLIAGKGHEGYQEFADTLVPFDDRQVARELIQLLSAQG